MWSSEQWVIKAGSRALWVHQSRLPAPKHYFWTPVILDATRFQSKQEATEWLDNNLLVALKYDCVIVSFTQPQEVKYGL